MAKKILYFDVETTGLDPVKNDIIQIAGAIAINGEVMQEFNIKCQPYDYDSIQQEALDTHGITIETLQTYQTPAEAYRELTKIFGKFVDKFNRADKFTPAGYNVRFDMEFLKNFFDKNGDKYFGSWLNWHMIDPLPLLHFMDYIGKISLPNYKLTTVCEHFGIEIDAHDALSDIRATREVIIQIYQRYF